MLKCFPLYITVEPLNVYTERIITVVSSSICNKNILATLKQYDVKLNDTPNPPPPPPPNALVQSPICLLSN